MYAVVQHNKEREEWHRLKEKNPRLAAKIAAKAAEGISESDIDETGNSSDDEDDDEARLFPVNMPYTASALLYTSDQCILAAG